MAWVSASFLQSDGLTGAAAFDLGANGERAVGGGKKGIGARAKLTLFPDRSTTRYSTSFTGVPGEKAGGALMNRC